MAKNDENYEKKWPNRLRWIVIAIVAIIVITVGFLFFWNPEPTNSEPISEPIKASPTQPQAEAEEQIKKMQAEIKNLRQQVDGFRTSLSEIEVVNDKKSATIEANKNNIAHLNDTAKINADMIIENVGLLKKNSANILANTKAITSHAKDIRNHESRITNAQRSANRFGEALMIIAYGIPPEKAREKINSFVTGDLDLKHLTSFAKKIPRGIKKAQITADKAQDSADKANSATKNIYRMLYDHGAKKSYFDWWHDQKLAIAADLAINAPK